MHSPKFTFDILSNLINLSCAAVLHWFESFVLGCESMPSHITCFLGWEQAVIRSTCQFHSVDVIENRIDLVVLNIQDVLAMEVRTVDENQLHSRFLWGVSWHIVELFGNPFSVSVLYKNYH